MLQRLPRKLLIALAVIALLVITVFPRANPLTSAAVAQARAVATASAGTYVGLRTLNALLSSAQEVEVGGSLIVQGTVKPLKALEPVDDTVERIAAAALPS